MLRELESEFRVERFKCKQRRRRLIHAVAAGIASRSQEVAHPSTNLSAQNFGVPMGTGLTMPSRHKWDICNAACNRDGNGSKQSRGVTFLGGGGRNFSILWTLLIIHIFNIYIVYIVNVQEVQTNKNKINLFTPFNISLKVEHGAICSSPTKSPFSWT